MSELTQANKKEKLEQIFSIIENRDKQSMINFYIENNIPYTEEMIDILLTDEGVNFMKTFKMGINILFTIANNTPVEHSNEIIDE